MTTNHTPEKSSDSTWHVFRMRLQPRPLRQAEVLASSFREFFPLAVLGLKRTLPHLPRRFRPSSPASPASPASPFLTSPTVFFRAKLWFVTARRFAPTRLRDPPRPGRLERSPAHVAISSAPICRLVPVRTAHRPLGRLHARRLCAANHTPSKPVPSTTALGPKPLHGTRDRPIPPNTGATATAE